ncbi:hypothetical protein LA20531_01460 [Lactobacillus amylovorus DSM 20531]|uniref:hypothetical protein n=1 Tax=Lactobacillus amylovorus TaxID=1604 RepID=UPI0006F12E1A|nr:hypothetical protein [Lactobacillus amylovorus]ATO52446.1 hypothetical protein LA20531_01460 [Lactobacillus amylovorus DSM 20531]KRK43065.1 hypothetical protein FC63_GL000378 [Lactobacillus amylovorus DSM 20531]MCT3591915.1 hypothetical protein [Lactobacillus amylovorus]
MANIFIDGDEIANQKDLNRLLGQNDYVSDSLDNHISETGIYPTKQTNGAGYPNNTTAWGAFANLHSGDKFLQLFFDDQNNFYLRSDSYSAFAKQPSNFKQIAWKSDIATNVIKQNVDINTLTEEGNFFVESSNMDHFPAEYQNQWYFLNVVNPKADVNRIKQTVTPDHSEMGWTMTRTGAVGNGTVDWDSWLISDFANGKILKTK